MSKQTDFVVWGIDNLPDVCILEELLGFEEIYELLPGVPLLKTFPEDVTFSMDAEFPNDTLLSDNLRNIDRQIVVSSGVKEFLTARGLKHVEFLPVTILDHRQKAVEEPYFILHPIKHVDCLDVDASGGAWDEIETDTLRKVKKVVLDLNNVDSSREIFRPFPLINIVVLTKKLADDLVEAGFTGLRWTELAKSRGK